MALRSRLKKSATRWGYLVNVYVRFATTPSSKCNHTTTSTDYVLMPKNPIQKPIVVIGDVHGLTTWKDVVKNHRGSQFVFLGDYYDPYEETR